MTLSATLIEKAENLALSSNAVAEVETLVTEIPPFVYAILVGIGLLLTLVGWRLIRPLNVVFDIAAGIYLGDLLSDTVLTDLVASAPWVRYAAMLVIGALCGYITHRFFYFLIFVSEFAILFMAFWYVLDLFIPASLAVVSIAVAAILALPFAFMLFQLIIPIQILVTDFVGSVLLSAVAVTYFSLVPLMGWIVLGVTFLVGLIFQIRSAILSKRDLLLRRFGKIIECFGYNAGLVSDDFEDGFRRGYR